MTTRDQLLARVRQNLPEALPMPDVPTFVHEPNDLFAYFDRSRHAGAEHVHCEPAHRPEIADLQRLIAGPSKTADIEQSLVIGAYGARSLMIVLV